METPSRRDWPAIAFAVVFPSVVTWAYFVWLADEKAGLQQVAYAIGKAIPFAFPVVWVFLGRREKFSCPAPNRRGVGLGLAFGALVAGAMLGLALAWLKPRGFFDGPSTAIRDKITGLGLNSLGKYAAVGIFYALGHSLLEEYYWRWFVFGQLRRQAKLATAIAISSLGFMAHHVILLAVYFGWSSPATYLFALSVAIGGAAWAWIYERSGSLWGPWLSHLLVDAAIFVIGYDLARDLFV